MVAAPRPGGGRKKKRARKKMTFAQREADLKDPQTREEMGRVAWKAARKYVNRHRKMMQGTQDETGGHRGGMCCSDKWFKDHWHRGIEYPPGMDESLMRRCKKCGSLSPPQCVSARNVCLDCQYASMSRFQLSLLPSSTSGVNLGRIRAAIRRGQQPEGGL